MTGHPRIAVLGCMSFPEGATLEEIASCHLGLIAYLSFLSIHFQHRTYLFFSNLASPIFHFISFHTLLAYQSLLLSEILRTVSYFATQKYHTAYLMAGKVHTLRDLEKGQKKKKKQKKQVELTGDGISGSGRVLGSGVTVPGSKKRPSKASPIIKLIHALVICTNSVQHHGKAGQSKKKRSTEDDDETYAASPEPDVDTGDDEDQLPHLDQDDLDLCKNDEAEWVNPATGEIEIFKIQP